MKNTTGFILLLASVGLYFMFISPQYAKLSVHRAEADQYESILQNVNELTDKRDTLLVKYQAMPKTEIDRLKKILPDNVDTVRLAMDLDSIASLYGISIKSIEVGQSKSDANATVIELPTTKPSSEVSVQFSFIASYNNFRKFIHDIEQSLRVTDIKSVSFESSGETGLYEYKVSIQTYWLK